MQDILRANELQLGHFLRLSQPSWRCSTGEKQLQFNILIPWVENEKGFVKQRVTVPHSQKVYALIEALADQIGLRYSRDFRIYLEREYLTRVLDEDECLMRVEEEVLQGRYLLVLKKMIFLAPEIEE